MLSRAESREPYKKLGVKSDATFILKMLNDN